MSRINLPINQVRLTNVAVVRINKGGKRFEIACYRNKVVDYRQGLEQDLSEVLQTDRIFTNVSKGEFCKAADLQEVFGTRNEEEIVELILQTGQVQVSDKERNQQLEKTSAQVAEWISKNCVHPGSDRPYTISQIRHAMSQAKFSVHPTKPLKRQYLDCVKLLQDIIPIQRAKMELLLVIPNEEECEKIEQTLRDNNVTWTDPNADKGSNQTRQYKILVDPSLYRVLNEVVQTMNGARIEIVTQIVTKQGDVKLESADDGARIEIITQIATKQGEVKLESADAIHDHSLQMGGLAISNQPPQTAVESKEGDSDEDDLGGIVTRRKQQKKARKKNRKASRRGEVEVEISDGVPADTPSAPQVQDVARATATSAPAAAGGGTPDTRKSCNTCGGFFDTAAAFRTHFKSDWHRFNQKLKMKGVAPISEQEFLMCDSETFFGGEDGLL
jgi:ribosome maturation protein SDO1